ncbi:MAG: DUF1573 domain-containing protein [Planctomycetia bacterium]|nr:DUF1573 domain-containing protein [Planctomycetia bacterium]
MNTRRLAIVLPLVIVSLAAAWMVRSRLTTTSQVAHAVQDSVQDNASLPTKQPKVIAVDNVFDFGVMSPGDEQRRKFTVRNDGEADLTLSLGKTTCKCTLAHLDGTIVPPGASTEIELEWHTEEAQFRFRQAAVIKTNDPKLPRFELAVEGSVRVKLATSPESVYFPEIPKNVGRKSEILLYSQAYDRIEIRSLESTLKSVTVELANDTSASDTSAAVLPPESRYFRTLKIEKSPESKAGAFAGVVRVHYVGSFHGGKEEQGVFELPVSGETVGDLSLHGRSVVGTLLNLGTVSQARGTTQKAYVHVRGDARAVSFTVDRTSPKFLQVDIGKGERLSPTITRFPIEVTVPVGAPQINLANVETGQGEVVLKTTHADHPQVRFQVAMLIAP